MARRRDALLLLAILALAALTRLPGLALRGQWDADQGNEMLVLLDLVRDGQVPLLGPQTFAGTFHHGALYYYLLAPAAFLSDADPRAVTLEIALLGIATVAAVWALGRELGGRWAGTLAGLLAAVSPALVLGSTFIWNPNLVPLGSAIALFGAVRAWRTRRAAWWCVAALGTMLAMQLHVSGGILLPPLVVAYGLDVRRRRRGERGAIGRAGLVSVAILAAGYLPLLAYELSSRFADTRGLLGYLGGGAGGSGSLVSRVVVVVLRSIAWPFVGVITEAPVAAVAVTLGAVALTAVALRLSPPSRRPGLWLVIAVGAWSMPVLAVTAPSLLTSIPGLPNDHYHTYLDPLVIALVATGIAHLGRVAAASAGTRTSSRALALRGASLAALVALVAVCVWRWPPAASEDGGWPLADAAAVRVQDTLGAAIAQPQADVALASIPDFKSADALAFPLARRGTATLPPGTPEAGAVPGLVLVCDPLFEDVVGAACGGPAEDGWLRAQSGSWRLVDRFAAGPRRVVSVYLAGDQP